MIVFEFSFFLVNIAKVFSIFVCIKKQLFLSLIFSLVSLVSISIVSAIIFIISFLLLTLGLVCSFSCFWKCNRKFFFFLRSFFLIYEFIAIIFALRNTSGAFNKLFYVCIHFYLSFLLFPF